MEGERDAGRGGIGGRGGGNVKVKSAAVVIIFCSLFLGTSCPLRATVSSTVFTGSLKKKKKLNLFHHFLFTVMHRINKINMHAHKKKL